jgi:hypothetical protein
LFVSVVTQAFRVDVEVSGAARGCTAVLKCIVPPFVKDLVRIISWIQEPTFFIYPSLQGGMCNIKFFSLDTYSSTILQHLFSASQSGKYSVTLHVRSRELRFPEQCQIFIVECGKNLVEYGENVRTPLIYYFHSYFKIKVSIRYFNLV